MGKYKIIIRPTAEKDLKKHKKSGDVVSHKKITAIGPFCHGTLWGKIKIENMNFIEQFYAILANQGVRKK